MGNELQKIEELKAQHILFSEELEQLAVVASENELTDEEEIANFERRRELKALIAENECVLSDLEENLKFGGV